MSHRKVRKALEKHLQQWATTVPIPVVYQLTKSSNTEPKKLEAILIPDDVEAPSFGSRHTRYTGVFRVIVKLADLDKGSGGVETIAENLASHFYRGKSIVESDYEVVIEYPSSIGSCFVDGNYNVVPVDVKYRADFITVN